MALAAVYTLAFIIIDRLRQGDHPGVAEGYNADRRGAARLLQPDTALFHCAIDRFDVLRASLGENLARQLEADLAERLRANIRPRDDLIPLEDGAFAILLRIDNSSDSLLLERAHQFLDSLRQPVEMEKRTVLPTACIGIARATQERIEFDELSRRARSAALVARERGQDQVELFRDDIDRHLREERELEGDLRAALGRGELALHYHPLVDIATGRLNGVEALIRWHHPERGMIPPMQFIPQAERSGLIEPLGEWVLVRAMEDAAAGLPHDIRIAVNLSPRQIKSARFLQTFDSAIQALGVSPQRMDFEITEGVELRDEAPTIERLLRFKELGATITLDDFGTGYSSLSYLIRFPFDRVKIDRGFVARALDDPASRTVIEATLQLARTLSLSTVAEGIEKREQLDLLRELGCDEAQGFLFCKPLPLPALQEALASGLPPKDWRRFEGE